MINSEVLIGVDYSINSPAICVYKNGNYTWASHPTLNKSKKDKKLQSEIGKLPDVNYALQEYIIDDVAYEDRDIIKMMKYDIQAGTLLQLLKFLLPPQNNKYLIKLAFEGYSYGSRFTKTNNIIELATATTLFKKQVLNNLISENDIFKVFSPKTIKMQAGNGNMKKRELLDVFVENQLKDPNLEKSFFWKYCTGLTVGKKVPTPVDDMIDAYFVVQALMSKA
jgi:hypothetical protein